MLQTLCSYYLKREADIHKDIFLDMVRDHSLTHVIIQGKTFFIFTQTLYEAATHYRTPSYDT